MRKNRNALLHGVHSREIILPGESRKQFKAHLNGTRLDFGPQGTTEDAIVFNMAHDLWRQRRVMALFQSAFVDSQGRCEVEKAEERRVEKGREKVNHTTEVVQFFEAAALLEKELKKTNMALGKLGANLRSLLSDFERLRPMILADAEAVDDDRAFKRLRSACELNARLDAQFAKKLQNLVLVREFKRQYRQDSNIKLLPHHPPTAHDAQVGAKASSKKTTDDDVGTITMTTTTTTITKLIQKITTGSSNTMRHWQNKKRRADGIANEARKALTDKGLLSQYEYPFNIQLLRVIH